MRRLRISKFKGMITDVAETHQADNSFRELYNWRLTRDNVLEKIGGYMKLDDYLYDSAINNISQLKRSEDDNIFLFSTSNIYRRNVNEDIIILREDYPVTQTFPYESNQFNRVRTLKSENRLWCVDKNVYPFFLYNLSDEAGINLNVWARLLTEGADTFILVDANDSSIEYKRINLVASEHDGTSLNVEYNDESNIYIFSQTWGYKFNYSNLKFEIVLKKQFTTTSRIYDTHFKASSFALSISGGKTEYKYSDFLTPPAPEHNYSMPWNLGYYNGLRWGQRSNSLWGVYPRVKLRIDDQDAAQYKVIIEGGTQGFSIGPGAYFNGYNILGAWEAFSDLVEYYDSIGVFFRETIITQKATLPLPFSVDYDFHNKVERLIAETYIYIKDDYVYVGLKMDVKFYYKEYVSGLPAPIKNHIEQADEIRYVQKRFNLNDPDYTAIFESYDDIKDRYDAGDYDTLIERNSYTLPSVLEYHESGSVTVSVSGTEDTFAEQINASNYGYLSDQNSGSGQLFYGKIPLLNQEFLYPYITEYNPEDWEIKMLGTPGRPYAVKNPFGLLTGEFNIFISYVTALDTQSESFKSEPYRVDMLDEKIDVYWAKVAESYYGNNYIGLRIYKEEIGIDDEPILIKEIAFSDAEGSDWVNGHVLIDDFTGITSVLNVKPYFPKFDLIGEHLRRLVMAKSGDNDYYYSAVGDYNNNPLTNIGTLPSTKNDGIVGYVSIFDRFIFFKNNYIYAVVGDLQTPQGVLLVSDKYGSFNPDSIQVYKNTIIFLGNAGICLLDGNNIIEISRGIINKWLFEEHNINELKVALSEFDIDKKEYRLYVGNDILSFNLKNEFYIERKLNDSHLYTSIEVIDDENNNRKKLFGTTQNVVFEDNKGRHWNGRKRWASLKSKKYKKTEIEDTSILNTFKLNAELNNGMVLIGEKDAVDIKLRSDNYYSMRTKDFCDKDIQFELYEKSSWDAKIIDMELIHE